MPERDRGLAPEDVDPHASETGDARATLEAGARHDGDLRRPLPTLKDGP